MAETWRKHGKTVVKDRIKDRHFSVDNSVEAVENRLILAHEGSESIKIFGQIGHKYQSQEKGRGLKLRTKYIRYSPGYHSRINVRKMYAYFTILCCEILLDKEDLEFLIHYGEGVSLNSKGYPKTQSGLVYRLFLKCPKGFEVDHINRNPLDNRRKNLRFVTHSQNLHNAKLPIHNTSGLKGVYYEEDKKCWAAQFDIKRKRIRKRFKTKAQALRYRKDLEKLYINDIG